MARVSFSYLITTVIILSLAKPASPLTFNEKVQNLEIDLNYVSQHARSKVDIVLVMDVSGSIDVEEFEKAKVFSKNLLEYFSIAQGHGQVGVVTFGETSATAVPLETDGNKCEFVTSFKNVTTNNPEVGGTTNTAAGLRQAWKVLKDGRYRTSYSLRLVVLITDGGWNVGEDPAGLINQMKLDQGNDGGIRFLVVAVGVGPSVEAEMKTWASSIQGEPMFVDVGDYSKLGKIAYALHNGTQNQ